ncbi:hypothetical protein [Paenibacillus protaetiae]|uniref:HTH LytTR-type domain-containing protein n=1 Tax=Paenibacillus protaetiae TaxID=2509456 RepID=A0A4P6FBZ0_9BACL|nr:hypothetical protein [Paenibacillus protaetiae]QAY68068.1 hypothetical protein ET464_18545 [Paenibacillus protaetiae]
MMNTTLRGTDLYERFDLETDILYFRIGSLGLVSFHGKNYNLKKRMTPDQVKKLTKEKGYYPIGSNCYVNIGKIKSFTRGVIYFGPAFYSETKQLPIPWRKHNVIHQLLQQQNGAS